MYTIVASSIYAVSLFWVFVIITKALKKFNGSSDPILRRILCCIKFLRHRKEILLVLILAISFALPGLLTQMLKINFSDLEVDGFQIV